MDDYFKKAEDLNYEQEDGSFYMPGDIKKIERNPEDGLHMSGEFEPIEKKEDNGLHFAGDITEEDFYVPGDLEEGQSKKHR